MIVRCKHRKNPPGDGGIIDGCGWQGEHRAACPSCGSMILREVAGTHLFTIRRPDGGLSCSRCYMPETYRLPCRPGAGGR